MTQFTIRFEDSLRIEEKVFVSYGFLEFITDVGGLLGLFLGCSMLSLMELVFYPFMTFFNYIRNRRRHVVVEEIIEEISDNQNSIAFVQYREFKRSKVEEIVECVEIPGIIPEE